MTIIAQNSNSRFCPLGFNSVPDSLRDLVPKIISREDITKLYLAIPNIVRAKNIANKIYRLDSQLKKHYISLLSHYPKMSHSKLFKIAKSSMVRQKVSIKLSKTIAKNLMLKAEKNNLSSNDMEKRILYSYLKF